MELWIRSQNKEILAKVEDLCVEEGVHCDELEDGYDIINIHYRFGRYKTKERALQILDEIQNKIKTLLYLKPNSFLKLDDIKAGKSYFEELNKIDFITCDNNFEIIPISTGIFTYEMPKE